MAMASPQYQQWKRQSVRRSAARRTRSSGVTSVDCIEGQRLVKGRAGVQQRRQAQGNCACRPIYNVRIVKTSATSKLLSEFDSELHGFDGVDVRIHQAIVDPIVALRIS